MDKPPTPLERAMEIAQRDQIRPIPSQRLDTGEEIWLVESRSQPNTFYLLTKTDGSIQCRCQATQHGQICAHGAAVRLLLQGVQSPSSTQHHRTGLRPRTDRSAEESQWRVEALRREHALPWTDDKPFSIWKS